MDTSKQYRFPVDIIKGFIALVLLFAIFFGAAPGYGASTNKELEVGEDDASQEIQAPAEGSTYFGVYDLRSPCSGDCLVTAAFGRYVETNMTDIFFELELLPWDWDYGDINFASLTFARKVADYGRFLSFEPEVGAGRRFGDADEYEFWGALYMRWNPFFWDHIVDTSVAVSIGVSWATDSNPEEENRVDSKNISFLHYFSPEITLAPPGESSYSFVIRLHHRSGAGGLFGESGGFQYLMFGLRAHF